MKVSCISSTERPAKDSLFGRVLIGRLGDFVQINFGESAERIGLLSRSSGLILVSGAWFASEIDEGPRERSKGGLVEGTGVLMHF